MHRLGTVLLTTALAGSLAACSQETRAADVEPTPSGVAAEYATMAEEIEAAGGEKVQDGWKVGYIVEAAEPWFESHDGAQHFRAPKAQETHHIEILPFEEATGRLVPQTPVRLEVVDENGTVVEDRQLEFLYGEFFHYATNFEIPESGTYTLRATIGTPTFARHGEQGDTPAMSEGTTVTFEDVELEVA